MYLIKKKICTKCGMCVESCPMDAIFESGESYVIDPEKCVECGECHSVCPVEAVKSI
ncbi:MAG TPA: 4Fe-4S binding protein [bacterium]|nr:4Fe-4S binding protein [bacterium]HPI78013.1 4Fe-4S binding protein [bacterium]HPN93981.1 4Fe-4S binding protein [bacterium]